MNTATAARYIANVVDTTNQWHRIELHAASSVSVKAAARQAAKAQGITVKYVNDFYIA